MLVHISLDTSSEIIEKLMILLVKSSDRDTMEFGLLLGQAAIDARHEQEKKDGVVGSIFSKAPLDNAPKKVHTKKVKKVTVINLQTRNKEHA